MPVETPEEFVPPGLVAGAKVEVRDSGPVKQLLIELLPAALTLLAAGARRRGTTVDGLVRESLTDLLNRVFEENPRAVYELIAQAEPVDETTAVADIAAIVRDEVELGDLDLQTINLPRASSQ